MGGTGLEPVTPSFDSEQRSLQFTDVRPERMVERNQSASEHLSERERTSSVAIVATRIQISGDKCARARNG
jgi:N-acyl-L-homoserine lactone synthetase